MIILVYLKDITEKKNAEKALKESRRQYKNFIDMSLEGISRWVFREAMPIDLPFEEQVKWILENIEITDCNDNYSRMYAYDSPQEMIGLNLETLLGSRETAEKLVKEYVSLNYKWKNMETNETTRDGNNKIFLNNLISVIEDGKIKSIWATQVDITEKKRLEMETLHLQKMESMGVLAGGLAHDFNNVLVGILGSVELLQMEEGKEKDKMLLDDIKNAVSRGTDITNQLLNFAKGGAPSIAPESVEEIIRFSVKLALPGSQSSCKMNIPENLPNVKVDAGQIQQALTNIIINADQAMDKGGFIHISANLAEIEIGDPILKPGPYIKIQIRDEGDGIPPDIQDQIFTPYFSTKTHGTGLGLASTFSIISKHGGKISFDTELGKGTSFKVYLPVTDEGIAKITKIQYPKVDKKGRILVMDDDRSVTSIFKRFLDQLGQEVTVALDADEALSIYKHALAKNQKFDLVFLDLVMPGTQDGIDVIEYLRSIDPDTRAVVCSGSLNHPAFINYMDYGFLASLKKPFSIDQVGEILSKFLK